MDYRCITLHNEDLHTIIDASIPNKAQNQAVKLQINRACDQLMNRIAEGWLDQERELNSEVSEDKIKRMADRFLGWKLPDNFSPDGGISFHRIGNAGTSHEYKREPTGTNLLDASQAMQMIRYLLECEP